MNKKQNKKYVAVAKKVAKRDHFFDIVATMYGVPVTGIDAIGDQPYLNKDGRIYLLNELRTGKNAVRAIRTDFIKTSTTLIEPAIVKKTIVFRNDIEIEAIGEASNENIETESVRKTLNMVAETRALNRAIWTAIGGDVMKRVEKNLNVMEISDEDRARIIEAGRASYEEMQRPKKPTGENRSVSKMYEATAKRIDQISNNEEKLRRALVNIDQMPLSDEQKGLIKQRIEGALRRFSGGGASGKFVALKSGSGASGKAGKGGAGRQGKN